MNLILPPKRFQPVDDPKYDPIRHRPWFSKLAARRAKIPLLAGALNDMRTTPRSQREAALAWNVDERELRDYTAFVDNVPLVPACVLKNFQHILDAAYLAYCDHHGIRHINSFIEDMAPVYGVKARRVTELWEVDPTFYPTTYVHR